MMLCSHREDINTYSILIFSKKISAFETSHVKLPTNASGVEEVTTWLNDRHFVYFEVITIDVLITFTKNVCIPKDAINGATVTINHNDDDQVSSTLDEHGVFLEGVLYWRS